MESEPHTGDNDAKIDALIVRDFKCEQQELGTDEIIKLLVKDISALSGNDTKIVALIGGAASGKTTLTSQVVEQLRHEGITADAIGTDDYVVGDRQYRRENFEGRDPRAKYDFSYMNALIQKIKGNHDSDAVVPVPTYNQLTGVAIAEGEANFYHKIATIDALVVEGDFLEIDNPDLIIYLHVRDIARLQNRLTRDLQHRNETNQSKIEENFRQRQAVQHIPYTLPAASLANIIITGQRKNQMDQ